MVREQQGGQGGRIGGSQVGGGRKRVREEGVPTMWTSWGTWPLLLSGMAASGF